MSNIDYLDTYLARINKLGANHKERELNASIADFEKYLLEHPSSETIIVDGVSELASIISDKQNENKMIKKVLTRLTTALTTGSLFLWDGATWIVYFQEKNPNQAYVSSLAVRCNEIIKWVNKYGVLRISTCYIIGNMMSTIKNNFRTWNGTITPLPNQFLDVLLPYNTDITIGKKFLFSQRAWVVVDYDIVSVPGIMYLSLTEDKIDRMDDDQSIGIAEYSNFNNYTIEIATTNIEIVLGTPYNIYPIVKRNGEIITNESLRYEIVNETLASDTNISGGVRLSGIAAGTTSLIISLEAEPDMHLETPLVVVSAGTVEPEIVVSGPDILRLGMTGVYNLYKVHETETLLTIDSFSVDVAGRVSGVITNGVLTLTVNDEGLVGNVVVTLVHDGPPQFSVTKTISIRSLW